MPAEIEIFRASYLDYQRKMWYFLSAACYFSRLSIHLATHLKWLTRALSRVTHSARLSLVRLSLSELWLATWCQALTSDKLQEPSVNVHTSSLGLSHCCKTKTLTDIRHYPRGSFEIKAKYYSMTCQKTGRWSLDIKREFQKCIKKFIEQIKWM